MKMFTAAVERCSETGLFVGSIPGFAGAHTQAESLDELDANLREVIAMLLEDGEARIEAEIEEMELRRDIQIADEEIERGEGVSNRAAKAELRQRFKPGK